MLLLSTQKCLSWEATKCVAHIGFLADAVFFCKKLYYLGFFFLFAFIDLFLLVFFFLSVFIHQIYLLLPVEKIALRALLWYSKFMYYGANKLTGESEILSLFFIHSFIGAVINCPLPSVLLKFNEKVLKIMTRHRQSYRPLRSDLRSNKAGTKRYLQVRSERSGARD